MSIPPIIIDAQAPLTINAQISGQIKLMIALGELRPGDALPAVVELAKNLGVNHNTVATAYNELIDSGYLIAQRGKGTFVAKTQVVQNSQSYQHFYNLLYEAFTAAIYCGLDPREFSTAAYAQAVRLNRLQAQSLKLVFVSSLQQTLDVYKAIQIEIGIPLVFLNLEDLKNSQSQALDNLWAADLIITTVSHLWDIIQIANSEQEVIAIDIKPDLQLLEQMSSLPRHSQLLLVGQEEVDSIMMKKMLQEAGISHLNFQVIDLKSFQNNPKILEEVERVCVSQAVQEYVQQYYFKSEKIMVFNFNFEPTNMLVLKARLAKIQLTKSMLLSK